MSTPSWEACIDWDATDWSDTPDFSEEYDTISEVDGVTFVGWKRGKETDEGNIPAATLEIRLKPGYHAKYSPYTTDADLVNKVRPWLPVRVRAVYDETYYPVFAGFLSSIKIDPHPDRQSVLFYVTDGMDLLARQMITQDPEDLSRMSDGQAMNEILNAAGWSGERRNIDMDGGDQLLNYPACYEY